MMCVCIVRECVVWVVREYANAKSECRLREIADEQAGEFQAQKKRERDLSHALDVAREESAKVDRSTRSLSLSLSLSLRSIRVVGAALTHSRVLLVCTGGG